MERSEISDRERGRARGIGASREEKRRRWRKMGEAKSLENEIVSLK